VHKNYCERATSENWIEQIKNQLLASTTLTNDFWANDILWQLGVLAYNVSVMMRLGHKKLHKQEHNTFRDWFIKIPGEFIRRRHHEEIRIYQYYSMQRQWQLFADKLAA